MDKEAFGSIKTDWSSLNSSATPPLLRWFRSSIKTGIGTHNSTKTETSATVGTVCRFSGLISETRTPIPVTIVRPPSPTSNAQCTRRAIRAIAPTEPVESVPLCCIKPCPALSNQSQICSHFSATDPHGVPEAADTIYRE